MFLLITLLCLRIYLLLINFQNVSILNYLKHVRVLYQPDRLVVMLGIPKTVHSAGV